MFHESNNLFFGRMTDGSVRVIKFKAPPPQWPSITAQYQPQLVEFDQTIPAPAWASLIATVSLQGEADGRFYKAQSFHMNPRD